MAGSVVNTIPLFYRGRNKVPHETVFIMNLSGEHVVFVIICDTILQGTGNIQHRIYCKAEATAPCSTVDIIGPSHIFHWPTSK